MGLDPLEASGEGVGWDPLEAGGVDWNPLEAGDTGWDLLEDPEEAGQNFQKASTEGKD